MGFLVCVFVRLVCVCVCFLERLISASFSLSLYREQWVFFFCLVLAVYDSGGVGWELDWFKVENIARV